MCAMKTKVIKKIRSAMFAAAIACISVIAQAAPALPQESPEGLRLQPNTKLGAVYLREGADFSGYTKVAILDCTVAFRKNWKRDKNMAEPFRVSDSDITQIKAELAGQLKQVFSKELSAKGTEVVTTVGDDVLVLRPAIINLDIVAPDTLENGTRSYSTSAGQMTLYLEIFDSVTGDLLARVIDPEKAPDYGRVRIRNSVTNRADADIILKRWAGTLATYLQRARSGAQQ